MFSHLIIQHKSQPVFSPPSLSVSRTARTGEHVNDLILRHDDVGRGGGAGAVALLFPLPRLVVVEVSPAPGETGPGDGEVGV